MWDDVYRLIAKCTDVDAIRAIKKGAFDAYNNERTIELFDGKYMSGWRLDDIFKAANERIAHLEDRRETLGALLDFIKDALF